MTALTSGYELLREVSSLSALDSMSQDTLTHVRMTYPDGEARTLCARLVRHSTVWPLDPHLVSCEECLTAFWSGTWEVLRHSGHMNARWRHVYIGTNGKGAVEVYCNRFDTLPSGTGLRLQRDGVVVASSWASRHTLTQKTLL